METGFLSQNMVVCLLLVIAFFLTLVDLAGNWWLLIIAVCYGLYNNFAYYQPQFLLYLGIVFLLGEIFEYAVGFLGIKRENVSWFTVFIIGIGAVLGAIVGTMFLPILGSVVGGALGACAVAYGYEYHLTKDKEHAKELAWITFKAKLIAATGKVIVGLVMVGLIISKLRW